jgi:hypothetical protein
MADRHRSEVTVKYGRLGDYLSVVADFNRLATERGWSPMTVLSPITGRSNRVVLEILHADLGEFERALSAFRSDQEARSVWHRTADLVLEDSAVVELLSVIELTP